MKLVLSGVMIILAAAFIIRQKGEAYSAQAILKPLGEEHAGQQRRYLDTGIMTGGWQVPGLSQFKRPGESSALTVDGVKVSQRVLTSPREPLVTVDQYRLTDDGLLLVSPTPCYIRGVIAYSVSNRIFAYKVQGVVAVRGSGGLERSGGVLVMLFYDEDGNGTFEKRSIDAELKHVPAWATGGAR